jgi:pimeloyl-ACP methyl ester carboxylesterase
VARLLVAILLASALAGGCSGDQPKAEHRATVKTPQPTEDFLGRPGKLVDIGAGRSLLLHCVGSGSPTVVLEAGFGGDASQWRDVQPDIGHDTRTCAYDRAGFGFSAAPSGVRDARDEITDLRRLLARARIDPPYVVVGHSYGGVLARVFAHLHPTETAGLVLIDTMGRNGRSRQLAIWPESQARTIRRELATTVMDGVDLAAGEALADRLTKLGDTPLAVITAGRHDNFPRRPSSLAGALEQLWGRMQDELAQLSSNRVHVVAARSSHDVPSSRTGQPSVAVLAVEAVLDAARDETALPPCPEIFGGTDIRCGS